MRHTTGRRRRSYLPNKWHDDSITHFQKARKNGHRLSTWMRSLEKETKKKKTSKTEITPQRLRLLDYLHKLLFDCDVYPYGEKTDHVCTRLDDGNNIAILLTRSLQLNIIIVLSTAVSEEDTKSVTLRPHVVGVSVTDVVLLSCCYRHHYYYYYYSRRANTNTCSVT